MISLLKRPLAAANPKRQVAATADTRPRILNVGTQSWPVVRVDVAKGSFWPSLRLRGQGRKLTLDAMAWRTKVSSL